MLPPPKKCCLLFLRISYSKVPKIILNFNVVHKEAKVNVRLKRIGCIVADLCLEMKIRDIEELPVEIREHSWTENDFEVDNCIVETKNGN